jgi:magnesium chelatase subunit D
MKTPGYPFAAIAGQPELKLALLLASVDWRLSVLLKGDKGSGKSTAARGLADILPPGAPFVNLPIGTTEDRLLGGLDLGQALEGRASLKKGLIHDAHGGLLYIDEVNLLADALTDALLDVASSGQHFMERDGLSASAEARFVLLGSMNVEEGALRPQLLDRFALALDIEAPADPEKRACIVDSRLRYDADPISFYEDFEEEQLRLREMVAKARGLVPNVKVSPDLLRQISAAVVGAGVRSLRADIAVMRASVAHAALDSREEVTPEDVASVLPFVLHHRAKSGPHQPPPLNSGQTPNEPRKEKPEGGGENRDRVFPTELRVAPELRVSLPDSVSRGRSAAVAEKQPAGPLDVVASFTQSFRNTGTASLKRDQLVFRTPPAESGVRYIFVVDASGSQAARRRMSAVKGAATALLESSADSRDEVAVVSFRGAKAEIALQPCRDGAEARRVLEFLPTGGRTPLAHGLELAASLTTRASLVILMTDGRTNVSIHGDDPWSDALEAARKLNGPAVLVDSSIGGSNAAAIEALASAMSARLIHLDDLSREVLIRVLRP